MVNYKKQYLQLKQYYKELKGGMLDGPGWWSSSDQEGDQEGDEEGDEEVDDNTEPYKRKCDKKKSVGSDVDSDVDSENPKLSSPPKSPPKSSKYLLGSPLDKHCPYSFDNDNFYLNDPGASANDPPRLLPSRLLPSRSDREGDIGQYVDFLGDTSGDAELPLLDPNALPQEENILEEYIFELPLGVPYQWVPWLSSEQNNKCSKPPRGH